VFVSEFPSGTTYPATRELANAPVWSPDSKEIFYFQTESRQLVSVRVQLPPKFSVGEPAVIPIKDLFQPEGARQFDIMKDGSFLILQLAPQQQAGPRIQQIIMVLNWSDELLRIAPRR